MENNLKLLGKRIAYLRIKKGLTQEKLAELVDYSPNHISKLESARTNPSFEILVLISKALSIELKDLFDFEQYKSPEDFKNDLQNLINRSNKNKIKLYSKICNIIDIS